MRLAQAESPLLCTLPTQHLHLFSCAYLLQKKSTCTGTSLAGLSGSV